MVMVLGLVILAVQFYLVSLGDLTRDVPKFFVAFGVAFVAYGAALVIMVRARGLRRSLVGYIFLVSVACRVVGLFVAPSLSTDIYRYVWEGRVIKAGFNPFAHPPEADERCRRAARLVLGVGFWACLTGPACRPAFC